MNDPAGKSWWGRNWVWVVPAGCLVPVVVCGGGIALIVSLVFGVIKSSDVYTKSLAAAKANAQVQAAIGQPIEPGFLVTGNINVSGSSGNADISYPIKGPKGSATVYAVAEKAAGEWTFSTLDVAIDATGDRIDLLSPP